MISRWAFLYDLEKSVRRWDVVGMEGGRIVRR